MLYSRAELGCDWPPPPPQRRGGRVPRAPRNPVPPPTRLTVADMRISDQLDGTPPRDTETPEPGDDEACAPPHPDPEPRPRRVPRQRCTVDSTDSIAERVRQRRRP